MKGFTEVYQVHVTVPTKKP